MQNRIWLLLVICLIGLNLHYSQLQAETKREITVFYPSPYGEYMELRVDHAAIGSSVMDASMIPFNAGQWIGPYTADSETSLTVSGNVGIGTGTARAKLDVVGEMLSGFDPLDPYFLPSELDGVPGIATKGSIVSGCKSKPIDPSSYSTRYIATCIPGSYKRSTYSVLLGSDGIDDWGVGIYDMNVSPPEIRAWYSYNPRVGVSGIASYYGGILIGSTAPTHKPICLMDLFADKPTVLIHAIHGTGYMYGDLGAAIAHIDSAIPQITSMIVVGKHFPKSSSLDGEIMIQAKNGGIQIENTNTTSSIHMSTDSHPNQIYINQENSSIRLENNQITVDTPTISAPSTNARFKTIYAPGSDYAEYFKKDPSQKLNPGDVVQINPDTGLVELYDGTGIYLGIVSSDPVVVGNYQEDREKSPEFVLVSLIGQVKFSKSQVFINHRIVYTKDKKHRIGILLANGKVLLR